MVASSAPGLPGTVNIRPIKAADYVPLAKIITGERAAGQPVCTPAMIQATLDRDIDVDRYFYNKLTSTEVLVYEDRGEVVGGMGMGHTETEGIDILWLAGEARPDVLAELISWVLVKEPCLIRAYGYANTISVALEGLPVGQRPNTHEALLAAGFTGEDQWSYQQLMLGTPGSEIVKDRTIIAPFIVGGVEVGRYEIDLCATRPAVGEIRWLEVYEQHQGQGHGRALLTELLRILADEGVSSIHLVVDDDDPFERDRTAAKNMYHSFGFVEVDRLWSYHLGELPEEER